MDKSQKNQGQSVIDRPNHDKKAGKDLAGEPEMKELKRMIRNGELDPDRTIDYLQGINAPQPFIAFKDSPRDIPLIAIDLGYSKGTKSCGLAWTGHEPAVNLQFGDAIHKVKKLISENDIQLIIFEAPLSTYHQPNGNPDVRGVFEKGRGWYHGPGVAVYAGALRFMKILAEGLKPRQLYVAEAFLSNKDERTSDADDALLIRDQFWNTNPEELRRNVEPSTNLINGIPSVRVFRHCVCCQKKTPTQEPRICPLCDHVFKGRGWDGIDAHWRAHHETVMSYEQFWQSMCTEHRG